MSYGGLSGGNVKGGTTVGATPDDFGLRALKGQILLHDVPITILDSLSFSDDRLTSLYSGRFRMFTDIGGWVLTEIIT